MSKNIIIGAIVVAAIALIGWLIFKGNDSEPQASISPSPSVSAVASKTPTPSPVLHTVRLTSNGPAPKTLAIRVGDAVIFTNESSVMFWPISDCSGFDAGRGLSVGESYTLVFTVSRTCTYRNNLDPYNTTSQGTIIIR
jgi:plastocyanin